KSGQFYTIHCTTGKLSVPMMYILLADKSQNTYEYTFEKVRELVWPHAEKPLNWTGPKTFTFDYERAAHNAAKKIFACQIYGCLFHFGKAIFRHIQDLGLSTLYTNNKSVQQKLRILNALAFLPEDEVADAFLDLI